jgi:hypothetical protein
MRGKNFGYLKKSRRGRRLTSDNTNMMKKVLTLFIIAAWLVSCRQEPCYDDSGTIIGFDYRKCMCCGGWFIEINRDTLRFDQLPEGCTINLDNPDFPIEVWLDWKPKDPRCLGDEIIISRMELKK